MTIHVSQGSTAGGAPSNQEIVNVVSSSGAGTIAIPDPFVSPYDTVTDVTLTGNPTFTFPAAARGKSFTIILRQDGTGGRTFSLPGGITWLGGGVMASAAPNAVDLATFVCTDGANWIGSYSPEEIATTWTNVSVFSNAWGNFGSGYAPARYRRDALGFVHLEGLLTTSGATNGAIAFTLPAGFRPGMTLMLPAITGHPGVASLGIDTSGNVTPDALTPADGDVGFSVIFLAEN